MLIVKAGDIHDGIGALLLSALLIATRVHSNASWHARWSDFPIALVLGAAT